MYTCTCISIYLLSMHISIYLRRYSSIHVHKTPLLHLYICTSMPAQSEFATSFQVFTISASIENNFHSHCNHRPSRPIIENYTPQCSGRSL